MKNKGFTLIELLAVIVILAIIALIATPVILGIINDARSSAKDRTAELIVNAVELAYQTKYATKGTEPTLDEVTEQLGKNGINNATISGAKVTSNDGVECTLSNTSGKLGLTCTGVSAADVVKLNDMTLATK